MIIRLLIYTLKGTSIDGTIKQTSVEGSHASRKLSFGFTQLGMIPGGGGSAAVVGESAIAKDYLRYDGQETVDSDYENKARKKDNLAKLIILYPLVLI